MNNKIKRRGLAKNILLVMLFLLFLPVLFFAVYFLVLGDPIGRMALHESATRVMTDIVGIEGFQIDQADIINATFNPIACWQILLDHPFRYQESYLKRPDHPAEEDVPEYIQTIFGNKERAFECFSWQDVTLGPGSVCASRRTCSIGVCVKGGSRLLYVTVSAM